ncbi:MAG: L-lactate dehydrogenase [Sumerlaeia bacterium]
MTSLKTTTRPAMTRIAIVGVGAVGATIAYTLLRAGTDADLLLVDVNRRRAEGEMMDLRHCLPLAGSVTLSVADLDEVKDCDLVIITAGAAQREGETRIDLVKRNTDIFAGFFPLLSNANPKALFLIITNPVDIMTRVALALSGLPPEKVIGSGTVLDTSRFRALISQHVGLSSRNVHAYVIGEHGDSEVMVWSRTSVGPFSIEEYCRQSGIGLTGDDKERINQATREAAYEIIERKGSTHFAIGTVTERLVEAMEHSEYALYTLSRRVEGYYGIEGVCLSLPTLVNGSGAVRQLELELAPEERGKLLRSAEILDKVFRDLEIQ